MFWIRFRLVFIFSLFPLFFFGCRPGLEIVLGSFFGEATVCFFPSLFDLFKNPSQSPKKAQKTREKRKKEKTKKSVARKEVQKGGRGNKNFHPSIGPR